MAVIRYLIICNINKKSNIIELLNTAQSFQFKCIVVGMQKLLEEVEISTRYDDGDFIYMKTIRETKEYLQTMSIPLIGIEINETAVSIISDEHPFSLSIAFMPGNEGQGLSETQKSLCNGFVFIPQFGTGIESLNVNVASSIVLYEYSNWVRCNNCCNR